MDSKEKDELLLVQLVLMFQTAALQHMGKLKNPVSDKVEHDLPQAQISIDMLAMLHEKMKGNLSPNEDRLFSQVLQELRLNYVDEASKAPSQQEQTPDSQPPPKSE